MATDTFLGRFPPFEGLDDEALRRVAEQVREERYPRGTVILRQGGAPADSMYVVVSGSADFLVDGRALDVMREGDVFGHMSLVTGEEPVASIRAREDMVCFSLGREIALEILGTRPGSRFITDSLRRRYNDVADAGRSQPIRTVDMTVGSLLHRTPLVCDPSTSVTDLARLMAETHESAAVFETVDDRIGIVTDADLRTRVLAQGLDPATAAIEIATAPAATVTQDTLAAEALFQMVEGGYHHLPVVSRSGAVAGVVTETDVIGFGADSPFAIRAAVERAADAAEAVEAATRLPGAVAALVDADVVAVHIGHIVGATIDVLTRRLLDLAFERHGPAPVGWAWLAFGSLGRHEQALHTDQDHGLAYAGTKDDEARLDPFFSSVAEFVTQGLEDAGIPRCDGNMMATSAGLRRSVEGWVDQLEGWIDKRERHAASIASVVFDFRQVAGPLDVGPTLSRVVRTAAGHGGFMGRLAALALAHEPLAGRFRDFNVEGSGPHTGTLDLKHGGIVPITDIARFHALSAGVSTHRTLDRLRMAAELGRIDQQTRAGLEEAFTLMWQLRLDHQVACFRSGEPADDFIDPDGLSPVRRQGLREAFRLITRAQETLNPRA